MNEKQVVPNALGIVLGNMQCDRSDKQLLTKVKDLLSVLIRSNLCFVIVAREAVLVVARQPCHNHMLLGL